MRVSVVTNVHIYCIIIYNVFDNHKHHGKNYVSAMLLDYDFLSRNIDQFFEIREAI